MCVNFKRDGVVTGRDNNTTLFPLQKLSSSGCSGFSHSSYTATPNNHSIKEKTAKNSDQISIFDFSSWWHERF